MPTPFSIPGSRCVVPFSEALRQDIRARTESDDEASSILRSIERFGGDDSVWTYEMTPKPPRGTRHDSRAITWSVRAVRPRDG